MKYSNDKRYDMLKTVMMTVKGKHDRGDIMSRYMSEINKAKLPYELDDVMDAIITNEKDRIK